MSTQRKHRREPKEGKLQETKGTYDTDLAILSMQKKLYKEFQSPRSAPGDFQTFKGHSQNFQGPSPTVPEEAAERRGLELKPCPSREPEHQLWQWGAAKCAKHPKRHKHGRKNRTRRALKQRNAHHAHACNHPQRILTRILYFYRLS